MYTKGRLTLAAHPVISIVISALGGLYKGGFVKMGA